MSEWSGPSGNRPTSAKLPAANVAVNAVVVGLRPDDLRVVDGNVPGLLTTAADVRLVEPLGPDALVYAQAGGQELIGKAFGRDVPKVGARVRLAFDVRDVHVFDQASGTALKHGV